MNENVTIISIYYPGRTGPVMQKEIVARSALYDDRTIHYVTLDGRDGRIMAGRNVFIVSEKAVARDR
jgi:hypothetical protein